MRFEAKADPSSLAKRTILRSNSLTNSPINVPSNASLSHRSTGNRNSMLEYRNIQSGSHLDAFMLNNFLDNLPPSEFDAMDSNELNSDIMSMSVPDPRYFDMFAPSPSFSNEPRPKERRFKTGTVAYPTPVGTSKSLKALVCATPIMSSSLLSPVDARLLNVKKSLKRQNFGNSTSNFLSDLSSRGYDSEPNCDRSKRPFNTASKTRHFHDDTTRKWVERSGNHSQRASLSLDIVKQSTWHEFDDDDNSKSLTIRRKRGLVKQSYEISPTSERLKSKSKKDDQALGKSSNVQTTDEETKPKTEECDRKSVESSTQKENKLIPKKSPRRSSDSGSDDVFESPNRKRNPRFTKRRSSSLDAPASNSLVPTPKEHRTRSRGSVIIKDQPERIEFDPKSPPLSDSRKPSSSGANFASNFHNNSLGANLTTKSTPKLSTAKPSNETTVRNSSDYDVRDRGRGRNSNGGRDSYRDRHRERDPDRGLSDREQRDSYNRSSFNRSMTNAEGTPEDKIGTAAHRVH